MAREFNGSSQYLERSNAIITAFPLSISCWFYLSATTGEAMGPCLYSTTGINMAMIDRPNSTIGFRAFAEQSGASSSSQYRSNVTNTVGWHGLAASWSTYSQVPNFWIDGVKATGGSTLTGSGGTFTPTRTGIGSYVFAGTRYYGSQSSRFAWCAFWNVALTDDEMKALTQTTPRHPTMIRRQSLVAAWDLGGHFGQNDLSRISGNDLTPTGSPTWAEQPPIIYPQPIMPYFKASAASAAAPWRYARQRSRIIGGGIS
jgi:hypothetical protein